MTSTGHHLRTLAHRHLKERECAALKQAIQAFKQTKSVLTFCTTLRSLLNTQEKMVLLEAIFPMIPEDLQEDFDHLCCLNFEGYQSQIRPQILDRISSSHGSRDISKEAAPNGSGRLIKRKSSSKVLLPVEQIRAAMGLEARNKAVLTAHQKEVRKAVNNSPSRRADLIRVRRDSSRSSEGRKEHKRSRTMEVPPLALNSSSEQHQGSEEKTTPKTSLSSATSSQPIQIRKVKLTHRENETLGFSIRGGKDLNAGIYVSTVDPGGQADRHGLKAGERILKVNDTPFKSITHAQAVVALKSARRLTLYVAPVGTMPGSTPDGTPRSEVSSARSSSSHQSVKSATSNSKHGNSSHNNNQDEADGSKVKRVTIIADEDGWLGCSIRGGVDYELDVTVANVDPMSPAYRAGLKKGLYITKVNGVSVEGLTHEQIVSLVTASNVVVLHVKPGPKKSSESQKGKVKHRRSQTADAALVSPRPEESKPPSHPSLTQSPKQTGRLAANFAEFELELQATPPVSTSTPLPPDNHPALIVNRKNQGCTLHNRLPTPDGDLRGISPDPSGRFVRILNDTRDLDSSGGSSTENTPREGSKFDMGTIRLNMANQVDKAGQDDSKIMNNISGKRTHTSTKDHVKDIFHVNDNAEEYRTPVGSPKPDRNATNGLNTPQMNRYIRDNLNILSSPYNNIEQEIRLANYRPSTPSKQLPIMKPLVNSQVHQELTGKRSKPPLCPNIPVAQTSPVSKFFKKMLRRNSESGSRTGSSLRSTSMESLNEDRTSLNSLGAASGDGSAMHRSAYDLMVENDPDVTLL
ncbi:uncharacterized protein LOC110982988 isoform X2 [Acanthaster planci]|uniref:Uncharacterized protein LOC110982988 isoform X2 n=1 Tax=Acanthaster planci TaxID=133434 RepID=A0A8B7YW41_ACAPL|nr:uncharacterized protein LOC110982988 isoform X2 [Acanthaster planci]